MRNRALRIITPLAAVAVLAACGGSEEDASAGWDAPFHAVEDQDVVAAIDAEAACDDVVPLY